MKKFVYFSLLSHSRDEDVPEELMKTDEGNLHSYLNCLSHGTVNVHVVFLANFPTWEARISHKWPTFLEDLGHQLLWPWCHDFQKHMGALKVFGLSKNRTADSTV